MKTYLRDHISSLTAYTSARDEFNDLRDQVFLDANENPYENNYNRYPDPYQRDLKDKIAAFRNWNTDNLFLGNGSDEILDLLFRCFVEPGKEEVLTVKPSYGMYSVLAKFQGIELKEFGLESDFSLDEKAFIEEINPNTKMLILCNPNNPTASVFNTSFLENTIAQFNGIVVIDEAYIDFSKTKSMADLVDKFDNLVVVQTLSKAVGLAGLRVGMAYTNKELVGVLNSVKAPYNISSVAQRAAIGVLEDTQKIQNQIQELLEQRDWVAKELSSMEKIEKVYPSETNFILFQVRNASLYYKELIQKGIVVRDRSKTYACDSCLRVSIGTPEENKRFIKTLKELL